MNFLKDINMNYFRDACDVGKPSIEAPICCRMLPALWSVLSVEFQRPGSHPRSRLSGGEPLSIFNDDNMFWQFQPGEPKPNVSEALAGWQRFLEALASRIVREEREKHQARAGE